MTTEYTPDQIFYRFKLAKGEAVFEGAQKVSVMVFGLNQLGSSTAELLARCAVGTIVLVDDSTIGEADINGCYVASRANVGDLKTDVVNTRISDINPHCNVFSVTQAPTSENFISSVKKYNPQISIDCTEDLNTKQPIVEYCIREKIKLITLFPGINMCDPRLITSSPLNRVHHNAMTKQLKKQLSIQDTDFYDYIMAVYSMEVPKQAQNPFFYGPVQTLIAIRTVYCVINYVAEGQLVNPKDNKQYQPRHKSNKQ